MKIAYQYFYLKLVTMIISFVILGSDLVFCQSLESPEKNQTKYSIGAGIGLNNFHLQDDYLAPYIYRGNTFATNLSFVARSKNYSHEVDLFFVAGNLDTDKNLQNVKETGGSVSYSFLHDLKKFDLNGSGLNISIGAGLSSFVMNSDLKVKSQYSYGVYSDQSWYWSHSLQFLARGEYSISENQNLSLDVSLPVLRIVSRPANGHWVDQKNFEIMRNSFLHAAEGGKFEFVTENFVIHCRLEYKYDINEDFAFKGSYRFNYISSKDPMEMKMFMNVFLVGIDIKL